MSMSARISPARPRRVSLRKIRPDRVGSVVVLLALLAGWQIASTQTFVIPSVPDTISRLVEDLGRADYRASLWYTVRNIAAAFAIGVLVGASIGVVLGSVPLLRRATEPVIVSLNAVPKIILYPLILPLLHVGAASQIVMGVLHAMFPILIMMAGAVAHVPAIYGRMGRSVGASRRQLIWHTTLPAVRKPFVTGARLAVSLATIGVIMAEFFSTLQGLGREMAGAYEFAQYDSLMGTTLVLLAVSFCGSWLIWMIERRLPE